jgi:hypothetical protein
MRKRDEFGLDSRSRKIGMGTSILSPNKRALLC